MENMLGKTFPSLGKRILYAYIAAYPAFKPVEGIPAESQRQMHAFLRDMLTAYYENHAMIGVGEEQDDCYLGGQLNNSRPELIKAMEKIEGKFVAAVEPMIELGAHGEATDGKWVVEKADKAVSKALRERLEALGLTVAQTKAETIISSDKYPRMFTAWRAYAAADDRGAQKITRVVAFIYQKYLGRVYTAAEQFAALIPDRAALERLEDFFRARGFVCSNDDLANKTRFAYVKWLKEYAGGETASMRVSLNWRKDRQLIFEFRVPAFRLLLKEYGTWDEETRAFVFGRLKTCDGCGYCTQTDKTGRRPRLCAELVSGGETALKCPLFPWFTWNDPALRGMDKLLSLFEKADAGMA